MYAQALEEDVCDGVISGIACVFPELMNALAAPENSRTPEDFHRAVALVREVIAELDKLPATWTLKWMAQARGLIEASFAQPVSARRAQQGQNLMRMFPRWQAQIAPK